MPEPDDITLLGRYAEGDESAFTQLFVRHVHLVYSAALRQARNSSHAEEVTQAVFILLARKAKSLSPRTALSGWLYQAARLTSASLIKREIRRQRREQEVYMQTLTEPDTSLWEQISPLLDEAMGRLGEKDRNAIVLRFFENRTPQEVAAALNRNEVTARKRVSRALEKMRTFFARRGVVLTTAIIAGTISGHSVQAAPAALANPATAVAIAKGAASSASTLILVKGALNIMAWTKAKTVIVAGAAIILAVGTTSLVITKTAQSRISSLKPRPWGSGAKQNEEVTVDRTTPKGTMLVMVNAMETGDAKGYVDSFVFTTDEELKLKPTMESFIAATDRFSRALREKFGVEAVHAEFPNMPFVVPTNVVASLDQKIKGDSATVSMTAGGKGGRPTQFTRIDGEWRMAADGFVHLGPAVMNDIYARVIKALDQTTPEISQGKFKTTMEAVDAMKERAR